jgi:hypothetical protein
VPTSYKILADPGESGLNVTLIGWAKNSAGQLAPTTEQTIFYSVAEPAGYNVNVQAVLGSLAVVTWTTDVPSFSVVRYRIQGDTEWMSTDVEAAHTMNHSHRLTGLIMDMTYEIEIQNSQITEPLFTYDHVPGAGEWLDIDKGSWTAVASKELSAAGLAIDGDTATNWWAGSVQQGTTMPQWLRIDMGSRYDVRMVSIFQVDIEGVAVTRCEIYVTDSESSNLADWGTMVGLTTEQLILGRQDVPVTPKEGRYIILRVWNTFHVSMREVWAAGLPVLNVEFTISDRTSGSTKFTNEQTVNVSLNAVPFGDNTVTGYAVTETGTQPDPDTGNWQSADALTSYTFDQPIGDVTLWAWAKDSAGNVASLPATIYFSTAVPSISNVVITEVDAATADVTWDTDVAAWGSVKYKALGADEWVIVEETEANFAHSVRITGLQDGVIYAVVTVANEIEGKANYYPATWPIEGDANLDCKVNILDLIFVRNRLNQSIATGDNWQADVNQDEKINILDLIYVRNKLNTSCP